MHEIGSAQVLTMAADTTTWWENEINHKILGSHPISGVLPRHPERKSILHLLADTGFIRLLCRHVSGHCCLCGHGFDPQRSSVSERGSCNRTHCNEKSITRGTASLNRRYLEK